MDIVDPGFCCPPDRWVCPDCVTDDSIRAAILADLESETCSYCEAEGKDGEAIAASLDVVCQCVCDGIESEYVDPVEELPYDGREGGYQGEVLNTYDVLSEIDDFTENDALFEDVAQSFMDRAWCQRDYFSLRRHEALTYSWQQFKEMVKHGSRYFFGVAPDPDAEHRGHEEIPPSKTLAAIGKVIGQVGLVRKAPAGTQFYRVRVHDKSEVVNDAASLGSPPVKYARLPNRMSPAGISMFYGATDRKTAMRETVPVDPEKPAVITSGIFENNRPLRILDLNKLRDIPSLYDEERRHLRSAYFFLHDFARDLAAPIEKDSREHIEYVPTQIVTEYFRQVWKTRHGRRIDGIRYRSAKRKGGTCVVLFLDSQRCFDEESKRATKKKGLVLVPKSIKHVSYRPPK